MNHNYHADSPINNEKEDAFKRYTFSKRIAETIIQRKSNECIVFGVYGKWGEGKTSVLNFIKKEILLQDSEYIQITFNPWRLNDEESLLESFFNLLAREIYKNIPELTKEKGQLIKKENLKNPLKNNKELIAEKLEKYGHLAGLFGLGDSIHNIGKSLANLDTEEIKNRVDDLLTSKNKRILIYIDDIDRLDKQEIYSLFRLVKLTCDFVNTTYILSFDKEMVSAAIGERFGYGDKESGENYLDKIIQVPLNIPKAQGDLMTKFCLNIIKSAIENNRIDLTEEENERLIYQISTNLVTAGTTPRHGIRLGNSINFLIPLLIGEINLIDLILMEALKTFYPQYYDFIKNNQEYCIGTYIGPQNKFDSDKYTELKIELDKLGKNLIKTDKNKVLGLMYDLFPKLDNFFEEPYLEKKDYGKWYKDKSITSPHYFDRYFTYSIRDNEISDGEYTHFINLINNESTLEVADQYFNKIFNKENEDNFIYKLRNREKEMSWELSKNLIKIIIKNCDVFSKSQSIMTFGIEKGFVQAAILVKELLLNHKSEDDILHFTYFLIENANSFEFAYEVHYWLGSKRTEQTFKNEDYNKLAKKLIDRLISLAGDVSIFDSYPREACHLCYSWAQDNLDEYENYKNIYFDLKSNNVINFIKMFVPTIHNYSMDPYKGDLKKEEFDYLISFNNAENLFKRILKCYSINTLIKGNAMWDERNGIWSEINMLRQFVHWYMIRQNSLAKK